MDRFSALKAFTRVVEAGSFTRAADSLNMPNATLSKTIQQLEAHLGVSLLQRTTRRITVTPEGREYYEKARCLLEDLEEIDASFNTARNKPKGHLRIAIGGSTACDVLIPLLADFMTSWPDIRIDLQVADKPADLISGNIDCAIRGGPMEDSTLIARKIGEATLVTCATPGYLQRYGTPASPDELHHGHRLISYLSPASGRAFPFRFTRHGVSTELKTEPHLGINESNAHCRRRGGLRHCADLYLFAETGAGERRTGGDPQRLAPGPLSFSRCLCPAPARPAPAPRLY